MNPVKANMAFAALDFLTKATFPESLQEKVTEVEATALDILLDALNNDDSPSPLFVPTTAQA